MRVIELTQGHVAVVDDEDFERLAQWRWHYADGYAKRNECIDNAYKAHKYRTLAMARSIMNPPKGMEVDHRNGNTLDNRRANLRIVNRAQNQQNRKTHINNKLGIKGVCFSKAHNRYRARIISNGVCVRLGWFKTIKEAKAAHDSAAIKLNGEFARLN